MNVNINRNYIGVKLSLASLAAGVGSTSNASDIRRVPGGQKIQHYHRCEVGEPSDLIYMVFAPDYEVSILQWFYK